MAIKTWVGRAASVAQVTKVIYSSIVSTNTYSVTINGKTISVVATSTSLATLLDALIAAWQASAEPEHQEMTAAYHYAAGPTLDGLQLTANTSGVPITVTAAATTGSATVTDETAASGPNFWNVAANWNGAALPSAADDLIVENSAVSILYGLTDTANYTSLKILASFTGTIGLPATNPNGYPEYRTRYLSLGNGSGTIAVTIGDGEGNHSSGIRLNMADNATTLVVLDGQSTTATYPIEVFDMKSTSTAVVYGGGVLIDDTTTGTIASLKVDARDGSRSRPRVKTTNRITATAVEAYGSGTVVALNGNGTTLKARESAIVTVATAAAIATVTISTRAQVLWESTGGIGTLLEIEYEGLVDFTRNMSAKTVAAAKAHRGSALRDSFGVVVYTAGVQMIGCKVGDATLDFGASRTISVA